MSNYQGCWFKLLALFLIIQNKAKQSIDTVNKCFLLQSVSTLWALQERNYLDVGVKSIYACVPDLIVEDGGCHSLTQIVTDS